MRPSHRAAVLLSLALLVGVGSSRAASAEGASLDGLMAPELTFPSGLNGVTRGTTLSSFRGRVVWLKFWLRDCPRCRRTLPEAQRLHEQYGRSGLVVLTVVHQYAPDQVEPFLKSQAYTFPVGSDPTGALAQSYQVNNRPTDYLVGVDGRVIVSNSAPEERIRVELVKYREKELGSVPAGLEAVRENVKAWRYFEALKLALEAAAAPAATTEVKEFAARVQALSKGKVEDQIELAKLFWNKKDLPRAREEFENLARAWAGTPFAARAQEARDAFVAATKAG